MTRENDVQILRSLIDLSRFGAVSKSLTIAAGGALDRLSVAQPKPKPEPTPKPVWDDQHFR